MNAVSVYAWKPGDTEPRYSGIISDDTQADAVGYLARYGHVVVVNDLTRSWAHRIIGCGVGHDDAQLAEAGVSHAAWIENTAGGSTSKWWVTGKPTHLYRLWRGAA